MASEPCKVKERLTVILCTPEQRVNASPLVLSSDWDQSVWFWTHKAGTTAEEYVRAAGRWLQVVANDRSILRVYATAGVNRVLRRLPDQERLVLWHLAVDLTVCNTTVEVETYNTILNRLGYEAGP